MLDAVTERTYQLKLQYFRQENATFGANFKLQLKNDHFPRKEIVGFF